MLYVQCDVLAGSDLGRTAAEATQLARNLRCGVMFRFNGVDCHVRPDDLPSDVRAQYYDRLKFNAELERLYPTEEEPDPCPQPPPN